MEPRGHLLDVNLQFVCSRTVYLMACVMQALRLALAALKPEGPGDAMLQDRQAYEAKLEEQLLAWEADLEVFKGKAKAMSVDGMMQYDLAMAALKKKHGEAGVCLHDLKATGDATWEQVKAGTDQAWSEFKAIFQHGGNPD